MSDNESESTDPWVENPRRLPDDLRQHIYALETRTRQKFPVEFTVPHGRRVEALLKLLLQAFDQPDVLPSLDDQASASRNESSHRGTRPDVERVSASLKRVQAERDGFATTIKLADDEAKRMRAQLKTKDEEIAKLRAAVGGKLPPNPTLGAVEALREKVTGLEASQRLVVEERDEARAALKAYEALGPVAVFNEYQALGSPSAALARERRLKMLLRLTSAAFRNAHGTLVQYASSMGPLLIDYDARGRLLQQIFREAAQSSSEPLDEEVAGPLAVVLPELATVEPAAVSATDTLQRLADAGKSDDAGTRSAAAGGGSAVTGPQLETVFSTPDVQWLTQLEGDATLALFGDSSIHSLLTGKSAPPNLRASYESFITSVSAPASRPGRPEREVRSSRTRRSTASTKSKAAARSDLSDVEVVDLMSSPERRPRDTGSFLAADPALDDGCLEKASKAAFRAAREDSRSLVVGIQRSLSQRPWPFGAPVDGLSPKSVRDVRETAWRLGLFPNERMAPTVAEYRQCLEAEGGRRRYATFEEVRAVYKREPWRVLRKPPQPVTFSPDDPRFAAMYDNAVKIHETHAKAEWERTHFVILDPHEALSEEDTAKKAAWSEARRRRFTKLKQHWTAHLQAVYRLFKDGVVDADFLLDPFFCWPPAHGVVLVQPRVDQDLSDRINEVDAAEPERLFFCSPKLHSEHIAWQTSAAAPGRPSTRVFDRIFAKFVPAPLYDGFERPQTPPPAPARRRTLSDQFASNSGEESMSDDEDFRPPSRRVAPLRDEEEDTGELSDRPADELDERDGDERMEGTPDSGRDESKDDESDGDVHDAEEGSLQEDVARPSPASTGSRVADDSPPSDSQVPRTKVAGKSPSTTSPSRASVSTKHSAARKRKDGERKGTSMPSPPHKRR